jgi:hypothetical protein
MMALAYQIDSAARAVPRPVTSTPDLLTTAVAYLPYMDPQSRDALIVRDERWHAARLVRPLGPAAMEVLGCEDVPESPAGWCVCPLAWQLHAVLVPAVVTREEFRRLAWLPRREFTDPASMGFVGLWTTRSDIAAALEVARYSVHATSAVLVVSLKDTP